MSTTTVPWITWFCPGHSTFFSSAHDSAKKFERRRSSTGPAWGRAASRWARWARRRSECESAIGLARLPVGRVRPAPAAVLAELDAVRRVPLGLRRLVVPPLALRAGEGDRNSDSGLGHVSSLGEVCDLRLKPGAC